MLKQKTFLLSSLLVALFGIMAISLKYHHDISDLFVTEIVEELKTSEKAEGESDSIVVSELEHDCVIFQNWETYSSFRLRIRQYLKNIHYIQDNDFSIHFGRAPPALIS